MCHFQLPSISIFIGAMDEKLFVHDLTKFDIFALVNSFFLCLGKKRGKSYVSGIIFAV